MKIYEQILDMFRFVLSEDFKIETAEELSMRTLKDIRREVIDVLYITVKTMERL